MVGLACFVDMILRKTIEPVFLLFQANYIDLFLGGVLTHDFKKDGSISVKGFVYFSRCFKGHTSQIGMIDILQPMGQNILSLLPANFLPHILYHIHRLTILEMVTEI